MSASLLPDPLQLLRETLNKLENGINEFAARKMDSKEFSQALACYGRASTGAQYLVERCLAQMLRNLDLPSRQEVQALAEAVQRVEDKLDQLAPADARQALVPRPPRSRRPLDLAPDQALAKARERVAKPRATKAKRSE